MGKFWAFPAKSLVQKHMESQGRKPFLSPYDMADLHQVVVYHVCKMVGGHSICLQKDFIIEGPGIHFDPAPDYVFKFNPVVIRHSVTDDIWRT